MPHYGTSSGGLLSEITERLRIAIADRYVIERELGAGGMATVYLAHDVKHDRKVALKVLRPELAAVIGAERFLQEIKVTANLQHSHILPLYDSGAAQGFLYYVMPYVEGETLRTKLQREKQLGVEDAIALTRGIAAALEHAHKQGIIHRDIKPENILLRDNDPMIADFGIALALSHAGGNRLTETGLSIGTPHYMSPEQAMGDREMDARSDVYSLGAMLYEMLAGDPPYTGGTAQAIVAKVITEKAPPVTQLRDTVPPHVSGAIQKALAKLPADRFPNAASFAEALVRPGLVDTSEYRRPTGAVAVPRRDWQLPAAIGVALVAVGVAAWGWLRATPPPPVARFDIAVTGSPDLRTGTNGATIALSPDGQTIAYVGQDQRLYVRDLAHLESRALPGSADATPFFSPDGQWVGFFGQGALRKVALAGGPPLEITSVASLRGATWGSDGTIVFAPTVSSPLMRVADGGGPVDTLTRLDPERGINSHRWPHYLPGGRGLLFQACRGALDTCEIAVFDLERDSVRYLMPGTTPRYVATGHLVYIGSNGALLAVPFDLGAMEVTGSPVSLAEGILVKGSWNGDYAVSENGNLVYVTGEVARVGLSVVDSTGAAQVLIPDLPDGFAPRFSPDGRRIAVRASQEGTNEIWTYDLGQGTLSRLTFEGAADYPVWSPSGDTIYYTADPGGMGRGLWARAADGSGAPVRLLERPGAQWEIVWTRRGDQALIREIGVESGLDLLVLPDRANSELRPWVVTSFSERSPTLAPDGRWAAYVSDESGQDEVYVRAFPEAAGRWQVSTGGGTEPHWAADGSTIYYRHSDTLYAVAVETRPTFVVGRRRHVLTGNYQTNGNHTNYDRDANGRFVMLGQSVSASTSLVVVLNWFEELRERMGGR